VQWRKLVEKSTVPEEKELRLTLLQELSERTRHYLNLMLGLTGLYLALLSLKYNYPWIHLGFLSTITISLYKYIKWKRLLNFLEENIARDPLMKITEKIRKHEDTITDLLLVAILLAIALAMAFM